MTWYSQSGQDEWVIDQLGPGHEGEHRYFVDVGAHDGITHSNTYALEQRGWLGLAIEPERHAADQYRSNRTTPVWPYAASNFNGLIGFDGVHVDTRRYVDDPDIDLPDAGPIPDRAGLVECRTLTHMLGTWDGPIDYLSIDVEGHELEVLDGMNFARWHVNFITIEHNLYCDGPARKTAIYDHLLAAGFELVRADVVAPGYGPYEDWYQHRT